MRRISPLEHDDPPFYRAVAHGARYTEYASIEPQVVQRFEAFNVALSDQRILAPAGEPIASQLGRLEALYSVTSRAVEEYKERVRHRNGFGCSYCGEYCSTPDVDHYLPKSQYGELSLYSFNLIPSCATCNRKLGAFIGVVGPAIYPYGDDFLAQEVFAASIEWRDDEPRFGLDVARGNLSDHDFERVKVHFARLGIHSRFVYFAASSVPRYITMASYVGNVNTLRAALLEEKGTYVTAAGVNSWPAVVADLVASDTKALSWLCAAVGAEKPAMAVRR